MTVLIPKGQAPDAAIASVIGQARSVLGRPYVWAGTFENGRGGDCSGLVVFAFKHGANISLPHFTGFLINQGVEVVKSDLQPGDLVFPDFHHVQIYTGNGNIIESPQAGETVRERAMWGFWRARRIIGGGSGTVTAPTTQGFGIPNVLQNPLTVIPTFFVNLVNHYSQSARGIAIRVAEAVLGILLVSAGAAEIGLEIPGVKQAAKLGMKAAAA